jgi:hypothetical protein
MGDYCSGTLPSSARVRVSSLVHPLPNQLSMLEASSLRWTEQIVGYHTRQYDTHGTSLCYQLRTSLSVCIMRPVLQVYKTRAAFSTWYIWRACVTVYVLLGFVYAREIYPSFLPDPIRLWLVYAYQMLRTGRCPMMPVAVCGGFAVCEFAALKRPGAAC